MATISEASAKRGQVSPEDPQALVADTLARIQSGTYA